jgi:hypothetical protein
MSIYAGDPKTNPTMASGVTAAPAGSAYAVIKACGLQFNKYASMAKSGFNSFSTDVPAKLVFYAESKVSEKYPPAIRKWSWF